VLISLARKIKIFPAIGGVLCAVCVVSSTVIDQVLLILVVTL
jgi:hypothetical protein